MKLGKIFKKLKQQKTNAPSTCGIITVPKKLEFEIDYYVKSPIPDPECNPFRMVEGQ